MVSIVLLGAGASSGSDKVDKDIHLPPLGNKLFDEIEKVHDSVASHIPENLKATFRKDFEVGMRQYFNDQNGNIMAFQRELARYLAQFTPGPTNEYRRLVKALDVHRIVYCTLNYDLLLELSASGIGLKTTYGSEPKPQHIRVLKLHGSCNVWPAIPCGFLRGVTFEHHKENRACADIEAPPIVLNQQQTLDRCEHEDSMAPAIAVYAEGKEVKVCQSFVRTQQEIWKKTVERAKNVFVVGVKVHPADKHIWDELAKSKSVVYYFGYSAKDIEDFKKWETDAGKKKSYSLPSDFRNSIDFIKKQCLK